MNKRNARYHQSFWNNTSPKAQQLLRHRPIIRLHRFILPRTFCFILQILFCIRMLTADYPWTYTHSKAGLKMNNRRILYRFLIHCRVSRNWRFSKFNQILIVKSKEHRHAIVFWMQNSGSFNLAQNSILNTLVDKGDITLVLTDIL